MSNAPKVMNKKNPRGDPPRYNNIHILASGSTDQFETKPSTLNMVWIIEAYMHVICN